MKCLNLKHFKIFTLTIPSVGKSLFNSMLENWTVVVHEGLINMYQSTRENRKWYKNTWHQKMGISSDWSNIHSFKGCLLLAFSKYKMCSIILKLVTRLNAAICDMYFYLEVLKTRRSSIIIYRWVKSIMFYFVAFWQ